jgi:glucose-1-phosphate adenylyltransferase
MGCIISGSSVQRSILSPNARVHSYCEVEDAILLPNTTVNRHSRIRKAIIDSEVSVPAGAVIGYDAAEDRRRHTVTENGIVVVTQGEECMIDSSVAG